MELGNFNILLQYVTVILFSGPHQLASITPMKYWMDRCPPNFPRWLYIVLRGLYATCLSVPRHRHPSLSLSLSLFAPVLWLSRNKSVETWPSFFRWPFRGPHIHSRSPPRPGKGAAGAISYSKFVQEESGSVGFGEVLRIWGGRVEG